MHQDHFYVNPKNVNGSEVLFTDDEIRHISKVKRKKRGDLIRAVDGQGCSYLVELNHFSRSEIRGAILETRRRIGEPVSELTLAQAVIKGDRFDWLVEKATELGIRRIIPMITEHSEISVSVQKMNRWKRVAVAAMKQCGRCILPEITDSMLLKHVLTKGIDCQYRLIAHQAKQPAVFDIQTRPQHLKASKALCLVGPEGGFSEEEIEMALHQGFKPVSLGPRRLRAETAGLTITTLVLSKLGELE